MAVTSALRSSLMPFTPRKKFLLEAESTPGHSTAGRIGSIENSIDLNANLSREVTSSSTVPKPTALQRAPKDA
jgi:hypothetical protein